MVCYNHNLQGVSFESCASHFLCSDAPEPQPGTGSGTGTGTDSGAWSPDESGATYGRWVDYTDGARMDFDCNSIALSKRGEHKSSLFFIGFAN